MSLPLSCPIPARRLRKRAGFTLPEMAIALLIGLVLLGISFRAAQPAIQATSVRSAEQVFRAMHARARAVAIERGAMTRFNVDPDGDSVWIQLGNTQIESFDFHEEFGIDLRTNVGVGASVCMTPRGIADPNCSSQPVFLTYFDSPSRSSGVKILPLGQIVHP